MNRRFERYHSHDSRDAKHRFRRRRVRVYRRYWTDSHWFGDQGDSPFCVGYAWSHLLVNDPIRQFLQPAGLYHLAQLIDEWRGTNYDGTSVRAGAKVLHHLGVIGGYEWANDVEDVINAVLTVGPVVMGTDWYHGMSEPDSRGFLRPSGEYRGGHAYLINGVNVDRKAFRVKNSYGRQWNRAGRGWLSFDDLASLLSADAEACIAVEQRPEPK